LHKEAIINVFLEHLDGVYIPSVTQWSIKTSGGFGNFVDVLSQRIERKWDEG